MFRILLQLFLFASIVCVLNIFGQQGKNALEVKIISVSASEERNNQLPSYLRNTAVVDGKIKYVVLANSNYDSGVKQEHIIGMIKNQSKGIVDKNITVNPLFLELIYNLAAKTLDDGMIKEIKSNKYKSIALFDQRVSNINLPLKELKKDYIGIFTLKDEEFLFTPNYEYSYFSKFGVMKLTPQILELLQNEINH